MSEPIHLPLKHERSEEDIVAHTSIWKQILFPDDGDQLSDLLNRSLQPSTACILQNEETMERLPKRARVAFELTDQQKQAIARLIDSSQSRKAPPGRKTSSKVKMPPRLESKEVKTAPVVTELGPPNALGLRLAAGIQLHPFQENIIRFCVEVEAGRIPQPHWPDHIRGCLLAVQAGLGKTACMASLTLGTRDEQRAWGGLPTLYVCPKNLLGQVRDDFIKFVGNQQLKIIVLHEDYLGVGFRRFTEQDAKQYDVIITNYDSIVSLVAPRKSEPGYRSWVLQPWFRIIVDECHEIREPKRKRYQVFMQLQSTRRIGMSGTPIFNGFNDLLAQLIWTGCSIPIPAVSKTRGFKAKDLQNLGLYQRIFFLQHKDVPILKLPPKTVERVNFVLSGNELVLHEYYFKKAKFMLEDLNRINESRQKRGKKVGQVQGAIFRGLQICTAPFLVTNAAKADASDDDLLQMEPESVFPDNMALNQWISQRHGEAGTKSSKLTKFVEIMRQIKSAYPDKKVVIFANYAASIRLAEEAMKQADPEFVNESISVTGACRSSKSRNDAYNEFRTNSRIRFLFMTLSLGSVGLNLSEASIVIMLEIWYSYSALHQAECRIHRIGQTQPVHVIYMVANNSIEERVYNISMNKKKMAEDLFAPQVTVLNTGIMESLLSDEKEEKAEP